MTYKDTISSVRGKNKLRNKSDMIATRTLKLLNFLYQQANQEDSSKEDIWRAFEAYVQIIPYIKPKLQAIAPAELDSEGNLTPYIAGRIAELVAEHRKALPLVVIDEESVVNRS